MQAIIEPGFLRGDISVPASKSMMQRVCAAALLHKGKTVINNPGKSEDDKAALQIMQQLGATIIHASEKQIIVQSSGMIEGADKINCHESGLSARLFTPVAALSRDEILIDGTGSLRQRPMHVFEEILPKLNVAVKDFNGFIPFSVKGPLQAKDLVLDGSISSQFLTGILFALTHAAETTVAITVSRLKSKPYIDLSLDVLKQFGKPVIHENYSRFIIDPKNFTAADNITMQIEADWSSAAYWLVGAAISGDVHALNLDRNSFQADKKILEILQQAGCAIEFSETTINIKQSKLRAFDTDLTDTPDLFPVVSVLAACADGESRLKGLHRLKHKESDREKSISAMLRQWGVLFSVSDDVLSIKGAKGLKAATINSYKDHRIAMAAAIGALRAQGRTTIEDAEAVAKSYPDFFMHLRSSGVTLIF